MKVIFALAIATMLVTLVAGVPRFNCPEVNEDDVTLLPNPDDCTTFYICNGGAPILMHCNPGLHFNADLRVCDWPDDANCEVPVSTVEPEEPATSTEPAPESSSEIPSESPDSDEDSSEALNS